MSRTLPEQIKTISDNRTASAPYNFVPLPEKVVAAVDDRNDLPDHDRYYPDHRSGYFDVTLETKSPTYVRCGLTEHEFDKQERGDEPDDFRQKVKNKPAFFHTHDENQPVIPGSSLRGMLRQIVEIVAYGKLDRMSKSEAIFYRAVAAPKTDPLRSSYERVLGRFGADICSGYVLRRSDGWYMQPATSPRTFWDYHSKQYLPADVDVATRLDGVLRFSDPNYVPQYHQITFDVQRGSVRGTPVAEVSRVGRPDARLPYSGWLIGSGNMDAGGGGRSRRSKFHVVLGPDQSQQPLKISQTAVEAYTDNLTELQKSPPFDSETGCLKVGRPVFYIPPDRGDEVFFFGHSPFFRIPATIEVSGRKKAAHPQDFVPRSLRDPATIDMASALFGFVSPDEEEKRDHLKSAKPGDKIYSYAGRISVSDAVLTESPSQPFMSGSDGNHALIPRILGGPKPTAYQHYLVQVDQEAENLAHYDSPSPARTVIRGHKMYWHQGELKEDGSIDIGKMRALIEEDREERNNLKSSDTQHTTMRPVNPGATFHFRVHFRNLSDEELGALCWALHPFGPEGKEFCHCIGMGKPLGMGSVKLAARLHLHSAKKRYSSLFGRDGWETGAESVIDLSDRHELDSRVKPFETAVMEGLNAPVPHLYSYERIASLLKLMEWPGFPARQTQNALYLNDEERPNTRYMEIEREGVKEKNEYKARAVLPPPSAFGDLAGQERVTIELPESDFQIGRSLGHREPKFDTDAPVVSEGGRGRAVEPVAPPLPVSPFPPGVPVIEKLDEGAHVLAAIQSVDGSKALVRLHARGYEHEISMVRLPKGETFEPRDLIWIESGINYATGDPILKYKGRYDGK